MSERPTPETDAFSGNMGDCIKFAEKLERERNEAILLLKLCAEYALTTHQDQVEEFLKKIK